MDYKKIIEEYAKKEGYNSFFELLSSNPKASDICEIIEEVFYLGVNAKETELNTSNKILLDNNEVEIEITPEKKDKTFAMIIEFMVENDSYCGESVAQNESCQLSANDLIADIVDNVIKPKDL